MVAWFSSKKRAKPVEGGRRVKRKCPECGATAEFKECEVESSVTAFSVVKLWDGSSTAFACAACGELVDLDDTLEPALSEQEQRELERETARALEADRQTRAREASEKAQQVDDELAAIKRKLGK